MRSASAVAKRRYATLRLWAKRRRRRRRQANESVKTRRPFPIQLTVMTYNNKVRMSLASMKVEFGDDNIKEKEEKVA